MKRSRRICVKCGDPLKGQMHYHLSTKTQKKPSRWQTGPYTPKSNPWMFVCYGPKETPGGGHQHRPTRTDTHYRFYSASWDQTACGLRAGRTKGKYAKDGAQVPWGRVKVDLRQTTCVECLIYVVDSCESVLQQRLAETGMDRAEALERVKTRLTMAGVAKVVGA